MCNQYNITGNTDQSSWMIWKAFWRKNFLDVVMSLIFISLMVDIFIRNLFNLCSLNDNVDVHYRI